MVILGPTAKARRQASGDGKKSKTVSSTTTARRRRRLAVLRRDGRQTALVLFVALEHKRSSAAKDERQWNSNFDIYLKPTNNAKQKHFEGLCQENAALLARLENVWHRARLRRNGQAGFELELLAYVTKPEAQATSLRRATAARIQEQMPRVAAFVRERQIEASEASQRYMAVTQARLPDGAPLTVPDSTTFRQLQHIDTQQAARRMQSSSGLTASIAWCV
ncbi:hypothetical protein ON010_g8205 [Phytophthora cinnamomi]|nr:hypothetical protein ON010_g8205 [Phytophthora cinnamomi]